MILLEKYLINFNNGRELSKKVKSSKTAECVKSSLKKISKRRFKSKEQKIALEDIKLL